MRFTDITLTPIKIERKTAYLAFSAKVAAIYREHGALRVVDCWQAADEGDASGFHAEGARSEYEDVVLPDFRKAANVAADETVFVSWVEWPDRKTRDIGLAKATSDPRIQPAAGEDAIFDGRRLIAGGFTVELDV